MLNQQSIFPRLSCYLMATTLALLTACSSMPDKSTSNQNQKSVRASTDYNGSVTKKSGGYYLDDGPGNNPPENLHLIPDAIPKTEPLRAANMRPYSALGKQFQPMTALQPYKKRGTASWYGRRYHGKATASGEIYDMYAMTAAHPTLPIPSYARVTNVKNNRSVIVRINDRGPFLANRLIDLSYTAAHKLGTLGNGSGEVDVEIILPEQSLAEQESPSQTAIASIKQNTIETPTDQTNSLDRKSDLNKLYVQLGAFGSQNNAQHFVMHIKNKLSWLQDPIRVIEHNGLHKIHAGPYSDSTSAERIAFSIQQHLAIKPVLVYD
ncbi:MAG: septal ring lytic transglycosylase RlpA family protein [Nitrosomonas sp.]